MASHSEYRFLNGIAVFSHLSSLFPFRSEACFPSALSVAKFRRSLPKPERSERVLSIPQMEDRQHHSLYVLGVSIIPFKQQIGGDPFAEGWGLNPPERVRCDQMYSRNTPRAFGLSHLSSIYTCRKASTLPIVVITLSIAGIVISSIRTNLLYCKL